MTTDHSTARPVTPHSPERRRPTRPRDAGASKQALLEAAQALFGQRGFERTTIREIGERAGVDAALIARYFGSKADLYIAAVVAESQGYRTAPSYEGTGDVARALLELSDAHGIGPVTQALMRADTSADIRSAARSHLARRLVVPMIAAMERQGSARPRLRAEVVVAALMGVNLARTLGWFDDLQGVDREELVTLLTEIFERDDCAPPSSI
jgi:AcrR family transcriptional regulator